MQTTSAIYAGLVSVIMCCPIAVMAEESVDSRENLATLIPDAIRLIEAKEYEKLLEKIAAPDALKQITESMSLKEAAEAFGAHHADALLKVLKSMDGKKPVMEDGGKKAVFTHDVKDAPKDTITFVKIDKYWYIQN